MKLLESFFDAIVRLEGDSLVMHVGEKPYVVTPSAMGTYRGPLAWGQVELSSKPLSLEFVEEILAQVLAPEQRKALDEIGAVEQEVTPETHPDERFTIVVARGGEDVWMEVRRLPKEEPQPEPVATEPVAAAPPMPAPHAQAVGETATEVPLEPQPAVVAAGEPEVLTEAEPEIERQPVAEAGPEILEVRGDVPAHEEEAPVQSVEQPPSEVPLPLTEGGPRGTPDVEEESPILEIYQYDNAVIESGRIGRSEPGAWETASGDVYEISAEEMHGFELHVPAPVSEFPRAVVDEAPAAGEQRAADVTEAPTVSLPGDAGADDYAPPIAPSVVSAEEDTEAPAIAPVTVAAADQTEAATAAPTARADQEAPAIAAREEEPTPTTEPATAAADETPVPTGAVAAGEDLEVPAPPPVVAARVAEETAASIPARAADEDKEAPAIAPVVVAPAAETTPAEMPAGRAGAYEEHPPPAPAIAARAPEDVPPVPAFVSGRVEEAAAGEPADSAEAGEAAAPSPVPERPVVVRIPRPTTELKAPPEVHATHEPMPIEQLIRAAMDAGGSVLYVVADARPMVRAAGQMRVLKGQPVITAESIDQFILESGPVREPGTNSDAGEWEFTNAGAGRVRCVAFHDRNGPGLILHVIPSEVSSLEQLGLPAGVYEFSEEADGLVIVAGPRASGKSTLLHALIDRINRTRADHVITIESRIGFVHETRNSLVSQREVSGDGEGIAAAARTALREGPDILVIDDLRSPDAIAVAIDAARAGRLILGSIAAPSSTAAVERLIDVFAPSRRSQVRALLAGILRGVVTQALVRDKSGARIAARELLLSSPAVRQLIADGEFGRLDAAIEAGRAHGMMTLSSMLLALVRDGHVDAAEARRHAPDREAFTAMLRRAGLDVSSGERLA